jgi:hypothetical protein
MRNVVEQTTESYISRQDDVIDGDEKKLNDVSNGAHNSEANCTRRSDLKEFYN